MRIDYSKQAVEEFAEEDSANYGNVVVGYSRGRVVAIATSHRSFMLVPLTPSEEEEAWAKANPDACFEIHPGHWKLIRKSGEPFTFEQDGQAWRVRLMGGQTFPATHKLGHRVIEGPTYIVQREWDDRPERAVLYFDAKLLAHALKNMAANGDQNQIAITLWDSGALRIVAKSAPGCMIGIMPLGSTGLVEGCSFETDGVRCTNDAHRIEDYEPRCKEHLKSGGSGNAIGQ